MGKYFLKLPKMGESVVEATLTKWLKEEGESVEVEDIVVEIATDKVDSDVPSEVSGVLIEKKFAENEVVQVGEVMAVIQTEGDETEVEPALEVEPPKEKIEVSIPKVKTLSLPDPLPEFESVSKTVEDAKAMVSPQTSGNNSEFLSPLVKSIVKAEGLSQVELKRIKGSGKDNRITKKDILAYLAQRGSSFHTTLEKQTSESSNPSSPIYSTKTTTGSGIISKSDGDQIIEMTRMAKLTADHMIRSKQTSAHVQSFIEADMTNLWDWREKVKNEFLEREGEKLTFTPLLITALIKALKDFPLLNSSVEGDTIIQKRAINIGMAAAMADGNLIVPVIKNADHLNMVGLAKAVNDLAHRARIQQLKPEEVQEGTFTFTNIGNFGSLTGTPIINQPQVGIVAVGVIRKMPAVIETSQGDSIAIRKKMIISHSYDHRIINGAMGGQFIKSMADYLENWDKDLSI
ncbi:MAG: dihydrolipoamide acetyltransferase family protein [Flavobacteriaceae bacterium]|jgi:2-oxoglutarate dehydrogenase E2 component (dihydrolipoamide succinyltransferase)